MADYVDPKGGPRVNQEQERSDEFIQLDTSDVEMQDAADAIEVERPQPKGKPRAKKGAKKQTKEGKKGARKRDWEWDSDATESLPDYDVDPTIDSNDRFSAATPFQACPTKRVAVPTPDSLPSRELSGLYSGRARLQNPPVMGWFPSPEPVPDHCRRDKTSVNPATAATRFVPAEFRPAAATAAAERTMLPATQPRPRLADFAGYSSDNRPAYIPQASTPFAPVDSSSSHATTATGPPDRPAVSSASSPSSGAPSSVTASFGTSSHAAAADITLVASPSAAHAAPAPTPSSAPAPLSHAEAVARDFKLT
ncbi:hypothetical protein B0T25DRAFT_518924 [Lasiosphaeria hispida]|uniref:Uncharacterized protein n=1 Tax=Lasiosphaeria hispida TaxID=260671 RepID=A0AAJ0MEY1_9PEZI|nr:hypothetical protein B0T25DRAFT_518924 [Lasiosphaeria hispida]